MSTKPIYFTFFESRHDGHGICIITKRKAESIAKNMDNYDICVCRISTNDNIICIPKLNELCLISSEINDIKNDISDCVLSINRKLLKNGNIYWLK